MTREIVTRLTRRGTLLTIDKRRLTLRGGGRVSPRVQTFLDRVVRRKGLAGAVELLRAACRPRLLRNGRQVGLSIDLTLYDVEATPTTYVEVVARQGAALCTS